MTCYLSLSGSSWSSSSNVIRIAWRMREILGTCGGSRLSSPPCPAWRASCSPCRTTCSSTTTPSTAAGQSGSTPPRVNTTTVSVDNEYMSVVTIFQCLQLYTPACIRRQPSPVSRRSPRARAGPRAAARSSSSGTTSSTGSRWCSGRCLSGQSWSRVTPSGCRPRPDTSPAWWRSPSPTSPRCFARALRADSSMSVSRRKYSETRDIISSHFSLVGANDRLRVSETWKTSAKTPGRSGEVAKGSKI